MQFLEPFSRANSSLIVLHCLLQGSTSFGYCFCCNTSSFKAVQISETQRPWKWRVLSATVWWCLQQKKSLLSTVRTNDASLLSKHVKTTWQHLIIIRFFPFQCIFFSLKSLPKKPARTQALRCNVLQIFRSVNVFQFLFSLLRCVV